MTKEVRYWEPSDALPGGLYGLPARVLRKTGTDTAR